MDVWFSISKWKLDWFGDFSDVDSEEVPSPRAFSSCAYAKSSGIGYVFGGQGRTFDFLISTRKQRVK